ncbi:MAG: hypothetical protein DWH88_05120 [Planctomycetota bacterium]|nr:MAG: hypothetical protein DWH88_05120 [Planctomycetota bacterium]
MFLPGSWAAGKSAYLKILNTEVKATSTGLDSRTPIATCRFIPGRPAMVAFASTRRVLGGMVPVSTAFCGSKTSPPVG